MYRSSALPGLIVLAVLAVGASAGAREPASRHGRLHLRIVERGSAGRRLPVPARVHLADAQGKPALAQGLPSFKDHFNCEGDVQLELPSGIYTYTVVRGPEYRRASGRVQLNAGAAREEEVALSRTIDLAARGWYSGETHVHRPLADVPLLLHSEDLHVAEVITVWNRTNLWKNRPSPGRIPVEVDPAHVYDELACEDERQGGALLYFNLRRSLDFSGDRPEFPSPVIHLHEALQQEGAWIDIEKPFWWDMPTWIATGKVRSIGLANNHMLRNGMEDSEAWGRPRDRRQFPAPRGNGFYSQSFYYRLLNCGLRIPPSAGSASGVLGNPVGYNRVYVHLEGPFSFGSWWRSLGAGRSFVTNGPILLVHANGQDPGHIFRAPAGGRVTLTLEVEVGGNDALEVVEVIRDGEVVERLEGSSTHDRLRPKPLVFERSGWLLARAIARVPETFRFASTAPFYIEVGDRARTVHRDDVAFFLRWIDERIASLEEDRAGNLRDPAEKAAVLAPHRDARRFFKSLLQAAVP
jgi:hypothetical protein